MKIDCSMFLQNLKELQNFILKQNSVEKGDDEDFYIQEQLDELNYYVKYIAKEPHNIFLAISDSIYFSSANWQKEKEFIKSMILKCIGEINTEGSEATDTTPIGFNIRELILMLYGEDSLLNFATEEEVVKRLMMNREITLLLSCYFYQKNLKLLGYDQNCSLVELNLDLGFNGNFQMSIVDSEAISNIKECIISPNCQSVTAYYDNLYSKHYINKVGYCQKIVEYILMSVEETIDGASYLESTKRELLEKGDSNLFSFYNNVEYKRWKEDLKFKEYQQSYLRGFANKSLDHIMEGSAEDSDESDLESDSEESTSSYVKDNDHNQFGKKRQDENVKMKESTPLEKQTNNNTEIDVQSPGLVQNLSSNNKFKLNKNSPSFKPPSSKVENEPQKEVIRNIPERIASPANISDHSGYVQPAYYNMHTLYSQPYSINLPDQAQNTSMMYNNYSSLQNTSKNESGMLISYNSSSMVGVIQSIPSGEEVFVDICELSSMGIGIDFLYNLAKIRLMCSFEKKYVYDNTFIVRAKATNLKIINIDVVQSEQPKIGQPAFYGGFQSSVGYY